VPEEVAGDQHVGDGGGDVVAHADPAQETVGKGEEFRGGVAGRLHGVALVRRTPVSALRRALRAHGSAFAPRAAANRAGGPSRARRRTANTPVDGRR
jgi:hypothetical protein